MYFKSNSQSFLPLLFYGIRLQLISENRNQICGILILVMKHRVSINLSLNISLHNSVDFFIELHNACRSGFEIYLNSRIFESSI